MVPLFPTKNWQVSVKVSNPLQEALDLSKYHVQAESRLWKPDCKLRYKSSSTFDLGEGCVRERSLGWCSKYEHCCDDVLLLGLAEVSH